MLFIICGGHVAYCLRRACCLLSEEEMLEMLFIIEGMLH